MYTLRLYCEEPGSWHPLPGDDGCYEVAEPKEWLRRLGPHLERTVWILRAALPSTGPILGMAAQEMRQRLSDELDLTQQVLGVIPDRAFDGESSVDGTFDRHGEPVHQADTDADFRVVASMLLALDPDQRWGGLSRTVTSEGLSLYVCSDHLAGYR